MWREPKKAIYTLGSVAVTESALGVIQDFAPKHIHAHWATYPSSVAMWLSQRLGIPYSFTCHAHDIFVEDQFIEEKLLTAKFCATISQFNKRWLYKKYGAEAVSRTTIVHCGVPPTTAAEEDDLKAGDSVSVLSVGRLDPIKGFPTLIAAISTLVRRNVEVKCTIIGEGPQRRILEGMIAEHRLEGRVSLPGAKSQADVQLAMRSATVFALPCTPAADGNMDGIPVVLMEAMALGMPVISTIVSGVPELISSGVDGILTKPGDVEALADAIQLLTEDGVLRKAMGARARDTVRNRFCVATEAAKLRLQILGDGS
jgi:glycosyltransferase involved in cell wall biosynthesis